jgi:sulfhydrogenase subunit beta (sulfur reductase)
MSLRIFPKINLPDWLLRIQSEYRLIGSAQIGDQIVFEELQSPSDLLLDHVPSIIPPKKIFLPQWETLLKFDTSGSSHKVEPVFDQTPTVVFGIHTCDLHAMSLMDRIFSEGYPDQHYLARRKTTTLVSIECLKPCSEFSFCKDMGTLSVPEDFDLHLTDLGNVYAVEVGSEKGLRILHSAAGVREATIEDYQRLQKVMSGKWSSFSYQLDFDITELPSLLALSYESGLWDVLGEKCLSCGVCNIVCPTCNCFDVIDHVDFSLHSGSRTRVWDSCQLDRFSSVAGGHEFRSNRAARLRHRFFHKFRYQPETYGVIGCVGCGRCVQECLVNISPVEVLNELYRRQIPYASIKQEVLV